MGERGPVPKRSDQRIRRNQEEGPIDTLTAIGPVDVPELGLSNPHPITVEMYDSLKDSAQSQYYEKSDWLLAKATLHFLDEQLKSDKPSAMMVTVIFSTLTSDLLVSEGARRRARLEIERNKGPAGGAKVVSMADHYKQQLGVAPPT